MAYHPASSGRAPLEFLDTAARARARMVIASRGRECSHWGHVKATLSRRGAVEVLEDARHVWRLGIRDELGFESPG